jgi:hypothetical protein
MRADTRRRAPRSSCRTLFEQGLPALFTSKRAVSHGEA